MNASQPAVATPARSIISLANFFDDSSRAAARLGPTPGSWSDQGIDQAGCQRSLGTNDNQIDAVVPGHRRHSADVVEIDPLDDRAQLGQTRVSGQRHELVDPAALGQLPADGVFPSASGSDQEDSHPFDQL